MDLSIRQPVWLALSDLFLDTDVRLNYPSTACALAQSPYSDPELQVIFRDEVAPIVEPNLFEIAGDWAGFPEDWLFASILQRGAQPYRLRSDAGQHLDAVLALAQPLRRLTPEAVEARLNTWRILANLYLYRTPALPPSLPPDAEAILRQEIQPAYSPSAVAYQRHNADVYPTLAEVELNWSHWKVKLCV
jgi:hypothetical protein